MSSERAVSAGVAVGELAARFPRLVPVLEQLGIDYCCRGDRPLAEAVAERGLDWPDVEARLEAALQAPAPDDEPEPWTAAPLTDLVHHIFERYHQQLRQDLPRLAAMGQKVIDAHGERHPEVREVASVLAELGTELDAHLRKEEHILFPFIAQMEGGAGGRHPLLGHVASPIAVMEAEHDHAGAALERLRALTSRFAPPADACPTFRAWYDGLATLERELHAHIHLENAVLFPRAQALEDRLLGA